MKALQIFAGPAARQHLREHGMAASSIRAVAAAAGGPKGLVLNPLDRFIFGHWLRASEQTVHLMGASIGAWRMACAALPQADAALAAMAQDYIEQRYDPVQGRRMRASQISAQFAGLLGAGVGLRAGEILQQSRWRLHIFTSHGRHLLARQGRWRTPLGYVAAYLANAVHRPALGSCLERVVFSDPRDALPIPLTGLRSRQVALSRDNLLPALLASCAIPFWLDAVHDIPGAPRGAYWDGGITDYHLSLNYSAMNRPESTRASAGWPGGDGLVLYPHFQSTLVPGWLDKAWRWRHRAGPGLDNLVVLAPRPEWIETLPGGKLPDRQDFQTHALDPLRRMRLWRNALAESQRLADEFASLLATNQPIEASALG